MRVWSDISREAMGQCAGCAGRQVGLLAFSFILLQPAMQITCIDVYCNKFTNQYCW